MKVFLFIAGFITFIATIRGMFISGLFNNTTIFLGGITAVLWVYGWFFNKLKKVKWLTIAIFAVIAATVGLSTFVAIYGRRSTTTFNEDLVIVLGAGIRDGEVGSSLARRLDAAISYHRQNSNALIIVTGGIGHSEVVSEAYAMAQYLIRNGVAPERILLENYAYSTYSNMRYARKILDEHFAHTPSTVVITSDFHMFRSIRFARQVGIEANAYPASTPLMSTPFMYAREIAAIIKMWALGR